MGGLDEVLNERFLFVVFIGRILWSYIGKRGCRSCEEVVKNYRKIESVLLLKIVK